MCLGFVNVGHTEPRTQLPSEEEVKEAIGWLTAARNEDSSDEYLAWAHAVLLWHSGATKEALNEANVALQLALPTTPTAFKHQQFEGLVQQLSVAAEGHVTTTKPSAAFLADAYLHALDAEGLLGADVHPDRAFDELDCDIEDPDCDGLW